MSAVQTRNGKAISLQEIPNVRIFEFRGTIFGLIRSGARISALFGLRLKDDVVRIFAVLAHGAEGSISILSSDVQHDYRALTTDCVQAHWFEREIAEECGIKPAGHPWLKPVRLIGGRNQDDFFQVRGEEIHEVAVGPVHAGVIEPGHFRFQCHGEKVLHLEIALGYQHRGLERALTGGPNKRTIHYMETAAGDTSVAHAMAYCEAMEALARCKPPARGQLLRGIALELERIANHVGDLGALAGDIGYLPSASYCGRIRGDFLNMTAQLCGSRFGRGMIRPGGAGFDIDPTQVSEIIKKLKKGLHDANSATNLLWDSTSVQARFEDTGKISAETCEQLGLVGLPARACGLERDARHEFPTGIFRFAQIPVSTWQTGDVFARAYVRWLEIQRSSAFVLNQLETLMSGPVRSEMSTLLSNQLVVSLIEGWRGEICHVAITDENGKFLRYKIVDPSFHNWMGLAIAMRGQQISDFPLCNKSFNLSYCGHDL